MTCLIVLQLNHNAYMLSYDRLKVVSAMKVCNIEIPINVAALISRQRKWTWKAQTSEAFNLGYNALLGDRSQTPYVKYQNPNAWRSP